MPFFTQLIEETEIMSKLTCMLFTCMVYILAVMVQIISMGDPGTHYQILKTYMILKIPVN